MSMNKNWAKNVNGNIQYADSYIILNGNLIINPTDGERRSVGELPIADNKPEARNGYSSSWKSFEIRDNVVYSVYEYSKIKVPPIIISKTKVEALIDKMGKTAEFIEWLNSKAQYIGAWLRGGDFISYSENGNANDLASLISALGINSDDVGGLIEQVKR